MKGYRICFLFFAVCICLAGGFLYSMKMENTDKEKAILYHREVSRISRAVMEQGIIPKEKEKEPEAIQVNQNDVQKAKGEYYLVEENGFLMVFYKDKTTLSLHTHMPITDFPPDEQEKLTEGIWFVDMLDVLNYLESYTS